MSKKHCQGDTYEIDVVVKAQTDMAMLLEIDGEPYWVPKSVICEEDDLLEHYQDNEETSLEIVLWWLESEEII